MTNRVYLDANVLIAHQVGGHQHHRRAIRIIDDLWEKKYIFVISSLTWDEFFYGLIFILRSLGKDNMKNIPFGSHAPAVLLASERILSWEMIELVEFKHDPIEVKAVIQLMESYNLRPRDAFHLRTLQQQKIENISTLDHDFDLVSKKTNINILNG